MRIGLDARSLVMPRPRGTGRNLRDVLRILPTLRPDWQFLLYHQRPLSGEARRSTSAPWQLPNVELRRMDCPGDRLDAWFQFRLPLAAVRDRVDLLHFPANVAPAWCPVPFVLTVHDLIPLKLPGELPPAETRAFSQGLRRGVRRARHIITVSHATRADLHAELGVPPARATVIPWAADTHVATQAAAARQPRTQARIRSQYGLRRPWWLSFSGRSRRKNAPGVLRGFATTPPAIRDRSQLLLVGCEPESYRLDLSAMADELGIGAQTRIAGFVPHGDIAPLLAGACGLLMPSRCEGFGLPILDAFAVGIPVLTANVSSMPEVAGNAAAYCDPDDPASIADGIARLSVASTAAKLVAAGLQRLTMFSWGRTAAAMIEVYEMGRRRRSSCAVQRAGRLGGIDHAQAERLTTLASAAATAVEEPR